MSDTKEKILKASLELFAEHGYKVTTVKMIADKIDVNELTIYRHFGSKDKILKNILDDFPVLEPLIFHYLKNEVAFDLETDLYNLAKIILNFNEDHYIYKKFLYNVELDKNTFLPIEERNRVQEELYLYFMNMKNMGKIDDVDIKSHILIFFSTLEGAFLFLEKFGEVKFHEVNWDEYINTMVKVLVRGLKV
ncbi:TetR/AcrR family transcriptional regulator [Chengkuizengella sediminis]|uniref:TetR/AcrR family transcriptional regulator n=1 Tax=Chengkuizengella sediminis TaxID=1885917 RepID=UPI00138A55CE|nr:TetR/AcrR family transcriptional regulator [Chengkuizengella sediminis]NDI34956.1 TetR/AcrR family transcriptional regulator [Chengkuizengella sediminis]